ncbi:MAG TPA: gamma carbonic anhydrase family protein [Gammaproteobacteria bacterium]|jgi:carbonic anhydrase/acetyltransferase-like protein (isoleucine patch superfamily)|nr:gamma carbonic anhydrase family protein [Chromatiales bacterium]MCP4926951.1 gamma carbonic anhydrase family protein [Gammaproteobacteria bacterium]MDP7297552.1 gamma carbonic anhydrase family protein [Gammaproteobacteria bacterium]MDP7660439.1 gamma carbonic anhydrase family protein [Gammaproteobacteria bacterium]HJP39828.1 gamma carbonic anhydrase family protein [Gammaproteobacteria bacterium]
MIYTLDKISPKIHDRCYIAPSAEVIGDVLLEEDTSIWFGTIVRGDEDRITVCRGTNVQDNSVLHCDPGAPLTLDEYVTVGHQAMLHGCRVDRHSLIGIGSTILNHAHIGANSIVGANALVTEHKKFPDGVLILGAPAKIIRELTAEEIATLPHYAKRYIERSERYRRELQVTDQTT